MHVPGLARLGRVQGHLDAAQQGVGVLAIDRVADRADAGPQVDRVVVQRDRLLHHRQDPLTDLGRFVGPGAAQQQREFIAADPGDVVAVAHGLRAQAMRDLGQQPVAEGRPQHIIDVLEPVQVEHQHRQRFAGFSGLADRLFEQLVEALAVGQAGETIPVGQPRDPVVALPDVDAHGVESPGQLADFVGAADVHGSLIVASPQPFRRAGQGLQRTRHPAGCEEAGRAREQRADHGDQQQHQLQAFEGFERGVDRPHHQCRHFVAVDAGQRDQTGLVGRAVDARRGRSGEHRDPCTEVAGGGPFEQCLIDLPGAALAAHDNRCEDAGQLEHVVEHALVEGEPHGHPADGQRRLDRDRQQQLRGAANHHHPGAVALAAGGGLRSGERIDLRLQSRGGRLQREVGAQEQHLGRADPLAVVLERVGQGRAVAGGNRRPKPEVGGQHPRRFDHPLVVLVEQTPDQPGAVVEVFADRGTRVQRDHLADQAEPGQLHRQQQGQEQRGDPGVEPVEHVSRPAVGSSGPRWRRQAA
jgi:hypothetical protein